MRKFSIPLVGKFTTSVVYGKSYYALDKKDQLNLVGIDTPDRIKKRYSFEFDEDTAVKYGIDKLPRTEAQQ